MDNFVNDIVYKARRETSGYNDNEIDDYIENNFNSVLSDLPKDIVIDWFSVLDYILEYQLAEYHEITLDFPLDKIAVWNIYLYLQVKHAF